MQLVMLFSVRYHTPKRTTASRYPMQDNYPDPSKYKTPHHALAGVHEVVSLSNNDVRYYVNFDTGECTCRQGKAWRWSSGKWISNSWCAHKMRAASSILASSKDPSLQLVYNRLLGERYIIWESVSAFHKELRRGDHKEAQYWALSVAAHRGLHGVIRYMLNILFEEARDLDMYLRLLRLAEKGRSVSYDEVMSTVRLFCKMPKKWELAPRLAIFLDEMRGYKELATNYTYAVARHSDIIPFTENDKLASALVEGICSGNRKLVQYGLKGLYKSSHPKGHLHLKVQIFNILTDVLNAEGAFTSVKRHWIFDEDYAYRLHSLVLRRYQTVGDFGYHELNALCDALTGEAYTDASNTLSPRLTRLYGQPKPSYAPPLGIVRPIPLYALDNHNHRGKHLMRMWGKTELLPGAKQEHIDFRWCGAYMGVAWRYFAFHQFKTCDIPWEKVKWNQVPWLWKHLDFMWY
jgi:hypothetical protein